MNKRVKIFFFFIMLLLFSHNKGLAQYYIAQADTSRSNRNQTESRESAGKENKLQESKARTDNQQSVKKVKSARPDMSKARGARPAYIQRQSGSGIPRGIGKPAGAGAVKPGKR